jgi:K(+)-stimulated pyrophosphate-energized sodium pump
MAESSSSERSYPWYIGFAAIILITFNCMRGHDMAPVAKPVPVPAAAPAPAPAPAAEAAAVPAALPTAKVYFEVGKTDLPKDRDNTLKDVVEYLKANAGGKAVISGFHDPTGDKAQNEDLAKNRAKVVREALAAAGIGEDRVVMQKPQETTGTGDNAEARRVEVTIQP